jgi:hypothetical protein
VASEAGGQVKLFKSIVWLIVIAVVVIGVDFFLRPLFYLNELKYFHEWRTGVESRDVVVNGILMHYLAEGSTGGRPVLLIGCRVS